MIDIEIWKDVKGFEGIYQVSSLGVIKSLEREIIKVGGKIAHIKSRIMKITKDSSGDMMVGLSSNGSVKIKYLYSIMTETFHQGHLFLEHKNGIKSDNTLHNIITIKEHTYKFDPNITISESFLTRDLLLECFDYHEEGFLTWKLRPPEHFKSLKSYRCFRTDCYGKVAGYYNKRVDSKRDDFGYWKVGITLGNGVKVFKLHRLIFLLHHNYLPEFVDHIDRDQLNNRIENLRPCSSKGNSYNVRLPINNTTGYKGVFYSKRISKPYKASIEWDGYSFSLGNYSDKEEAACAYNIAAKLLFKDFSALNETDYREEDFKWSCKFFLNTYTEIECGVFDWTKKKKRAPRVKNGGANDYITL